MNEAILRHLGVALLGHLDSHPNQIPLSLVETYRDYRTTKGKFEDLLIAPSLRPYLISEELPIQDNLIGRATLAALGVLFGEIPLKSANGYLDIVRSERLFTRLQTRIRIRKFQGDS